jgi:hypothetical protein
VQEGGMKLEACVQFCPATTVSSFIYIYGKWVVHCHAAAAQSGLCERNLYRTYDVPRED